MKADALFGENCEQNAAFLCAATKAPRVKVNFILISPLSKG